MEMQETTVGKSQNQDVGVAASIGETERRLKAYCDALGNLGGEPRPQILPFRQSDGVSEDQDGQKREGRSSNASIANTLAASCYKGVGDDGMTLIRQARPAPKILQHVRNAEGETTHYNVNDIAGTLKQPSGNQQNFVMEGETQVEDEVIPVLTPDRPKKRQNGRRFKTNGEPSFTLTGLDLHGVMVNSRIRRLTPMECERLQSFPDDWTKYRIENGVIKEVADTHRYKQLGNAVTTFVISAIGVALAWEIPLKNPPASAP